MLTSQEKKTLGFIMEWMDSHVDERGVRCAPHRHMIVAAGHGFLVGSLRSKGYLQFTRDGLYPTAKAEAWWIRKKYEPSSF